MTKKTKPKTAAKAMKFQILEEADVAVDSLVDDADNENTHTEENLAVITASLKRFGQVRRLTVRKSDLIVFAGNGVLDCLRRLGWAKARVQFVEGPDLECRAYAVVDNQSTRLSRFNDERLAETLQKLQAADAEGSLLEAAGFNAEGLSDLLASLADHDHALQDKLPRGKGGATATCPKCGEQFQLGGTDE